jgi:hypothetical protein
MSDEQKSLLLGLAVVGVSLVGTYVIQRLYIRNAEKMMIRLHEARILAAEVPEK